ncbi:MAG TPA: folylpolyglutamate synthase/dihydrofolate synthase family protein [Gemmatimonadaceae bacterium]|nr:folylpolyglutamate synthase/dihydrofolate synthase family protein [Gemmatimonadaceae bacterium]
MDRGLTPERGSLDALFARTGSTSEFGLERTIALLERLGNPHEKFPSFHVAGTNGKGSVVTTIYSLLRAKGRRVGKYMSPHLCLFSERIVVDEERIDADYVERFLNRWMPAAEALGATFFEITTAMAFDYFASREVDVAVIETGLGGRLDATNVIRPIVAGITSISIDHTEYLGKTEEAIATEKAGIFKRSAPSVIGEMSTNARVAIYRAAALSGVAAVIDASRLYKTSDVVVGADGTNFTLTHGGETARVTTGLIGAAQAANTSVALSMLKSAGADWSVSIDVARDVLPKVRLAGRFQRFEHFIFDVAHNPDGMASFARTLAQIKPERPIVGVLGILADKNWREMMKILSSVVDRIILVQPPGAPPSRAWNPVEALAFANETGIRASIDADFGNAVTTRSEAETVVVTGSFHTVGDALMLLGAPDV